MGVKDRIVGAGDSVTSSVSDRTPDSGEVKYKARKAASVAQENPLGLAIGSVAVGFIAGMLIPSTRVEDDKLGAVADDVKAKVKETGQEALEHGKQVAQDAAKSAQETIKESGQEHAQQVKDSASRAPRTSAPPRPRPANPSTPRTDRHPDKARSRVVRPSGAVARGTTAPSRSPLRRPPEPAGLKKQRASVWSAPHRAASGGRLRQ